MQTPPLLVQGSLPYTHSLILSRPLGARQFIKRMQSVWSRGLRSEAFERKGHCTGAVQSGGGGGGGGAELGAGSSSQRASPATLKVAVTTVITLFTCKIELGKISSLQKNYRSQSSMKNSQMFFTQSYLSLTFYPVCSIICLLSLCLPPSLYVCFL